MNNEVRTSGARALLCITLTTVAMGAGAQPRGDPVAFAATTLSLSADGEARSPPDMATITLGVDTTESSAGRAMAANATRMTSVISALKAAGLSSRDLRTLNISLSPQYAYDQGQPPRLTGYQVSNQVVVTINDLARLGAAVDAVVAAGATSVGQISFGLSNPVAAENSARVAAVKALADKAALYAQATGYRVSRLVNLSEGGGVEPGPVRPMAVMALQKAAAPTPVEAGELKVRVAISGVYELTH